MGSSGGLTDKRRFNRVERELMRCARLGAEADFTGMAGPGGAKAEVSGAFLSDLWLGRIDGAVPDPTGIKIKGLKIAGEIDVSGARYDARMRSPLVSFDAEDCVIADGFSMAGARTGSIGLTSCTVGSAPDGDKKGLAIHALSAEIIGSFILTDCIVEGGTQLGNAIVDDVVAIARCRLGEFGAAWAEIRGNLTINRSHIAGSTDKTLVLVETQISGVLTISASCVVGGVNLSLLRATTVSLTACHFTGSDQPVRCRKLATAENFQCFGVTLRSGLDATGLMIGGDLMWTNVVSGSARRDGLIGLSQITVGGVFSVHKSRFNGMVSLFQAKIGSNLSLVGSRATSRVKEGGIAFYAEGAACRTFELNDCRMKGQISIRNAQVQRVKFAQLAVMGWDLTTDKVTGLARSAFAGVDAEQLQVAGDLDIEQCAIAGGISALRCSIGGDLYLGNSVLGSTRLSRSFDMSLGSVGRRLMIAESAMLGGIGLVSARLFDLRLLGCWIGAPHEKLENGLTIDATGVQIAEHVNFGWATGPFLRNQIVGRIGLSGATIGKHLLLRCVSIRTAEGGVALDLTRTQIGGDLWIAPTREFAGVAHAEPGRCAKVTGRIVADHAQIGGNLTVDGGSQLLAERDAAPCCAETALSLRHARIEGRLLVGKGEVRGRIDLRNASVARVQDRGGTAWETQLQMKPGGLLLDGLAYQDLDSAPDAPAPQPDPGKRAGPELWLKQWRHRHGRAHFQVDRRITWLEMQYAERRATPATFQPQPYDQLARHFVQNGNERGRRRVHIARRNLQRRNAGLGWVERGVEQILSWTGGYGYAPGQAAAVTAAFLAIGTLLAWWIAAAGGIVPADAKAPPEQTFSPFLYAVDAAVPFLDLGADSDWSVAPAKLGAWWGRDWIVPLMLALYRVIGLVLLSITLLTFSGILREKE